MMDVRWSDNARNDIQRLYAFLAPVNEAAAKRVVAALVAAPRRIAENPRIGEKIDEFEPREVRRIVVGHYEMRYELRDRMVFVLRLWHTREEH
jgi:plasmid stabilization system protein ParE